MADITGDNGPNTLPGTTGDDTIRGLGDNDTLQGLEGNDRLEGGDGADTLEGGDGDDTLLGGLGNDTITGGAGIDTVSYEDISVVNGIGVGVYLWRPENQQRSQGDGGFDIITGVENVIGSQISDTLEGDGSNNVLTGLGGDDLLVGHGGDDTMIGGAGEDFLRGRDGNDIAYGGLDNDFFSGGEGNDLMDGGDGFDRVSMGLSLPTDIQSGATVDLNIQGVAQNTGHGMDTLVNIEHVSGTTFADTLTGNAGDNWIWGVGGGDTLNGGDGNDVLETGSAGANVLNGGAGVDTANFYNNNDFTSGIVASLLLQGVAQATSGGTLTLTGIENLSGSAFGDTLTGDGASNTLAGNSGHDVLDGGDGDDVLLGDGAIRMTSNQGGSGPITTIEDVATFFNNPSYVGNDTLRGGAGADTLNGGGGDDLLLGGLGNDTITGGAGVDTVSYEDISVAGGIGVGVYLWRPENQQRSQGDGGFDIITGVENVIGSQISDTLEGDEGNNVLTGLGGNDLLVGHGGDDTMIGGAGEDFLRGRDGNDIAYGGADNDFFSGGEGDDLMDGGDGWDRASMFLSLASDAQVGATVDLAITTAQNTGHGMDTFVSIEHVSGTSFDDTLYGNSGDNWLWGIGGGAGDTLDGRDGNDLLEAGVGANVLTGGNGVDTVRLFDNIVPPLNVTINLNLQGAAQDTGSGLMTLSGIENLTGTTGTDTLTGDGVANTLAGAQGDDTLLGGGGGDTLLGDGDIRMVSNQGGSGPITVIENLATFFGNAAYIGNDHLDGGDGDDILFGGGGDDVLVGGLGFNQLHGDAGSDTVSYASATAAVFVNLATNYGGEYASGAFSDQLSGVENAEGSDFNDELRGDDAANILSGGAGSDYILGNGGDDTLEGGDQDDYLRGGDGNDDITGGDDNDYVHGGEGDDTLDGGAGYDRVAFNLQAGEPQVGVTVDLNVQGVAQDTGHGMDTLISIEHASGTIYNDTLDGNDEDNWLWGQDGDDVILGNGGDDMVEVGAGNHQADGGADYDILRFNLLTQTDVTFSLALQGSSQSFGGGTITASGFEAVSGGTGADTLTGDEFGNMLAGSSGDDALNGGDGNDQLYGDALAAISGIGYSGEVQVFVDIAMTEGDPALSGDDVLHGGAGDDFLHGAGGDDQLYGDDDDDSFSGGGGDDYIDGGSGNDLVHVGGRRSDFTVYRHNGELHLLDQRDGSIERVIGVETFQFSAEEGGGPLVEFTLTELEAEAAPYANDDILQTTLGLTALVDSSVLLLNDEFNAGDTVQILYVSNFQGLTVNFVGSQLQITSSAASGSFDYTIEGDFGTHTGTVTVNAVTTNGSANVVSPTGGPVVVDFQGQGGNDTLSGTANADRLLGGTGNDILNGGLGTDQMEGGAGNDTYEVESAGDVVVELANEGDDLVNSSISYALGDNVERLTLLGSALTATGNALNNTLTGNDQDNVIDGGAGADVMKGGLGNDTFHVDDAGDTVSDTGGVDTVVTTLSSYTLGSTTLENLTFGGTGDFTGTGTSLGNVLTGGAGNDRLDGLAGTDTMIGLGGNDTYVVAQTTDIVTEADGGGTDTVETSVSYTLSAFVENLIATGTGAINLTGNSGDNTLTGNSGANVLSGGGGLDTLIGGAGADTYTVTVGSEVIVEDVGGGSDIVNASVSYTLGAGQEIERLNLLGAAVSGTGNALANTIVGNALDNVLDGGAGADILQGGLGADTYYVDNTGDVITETGVGTDTVIASGINSFTLATLVENLTFVGATNFTANGNSLANVLTGGAGNDVLNGNDGDDVLVGGGGTDALKGGLGNDTYHVDSADDALSDTGGVDTVVTSLNSYTLSSSAFENLTFSGTGDFVGTGTSLANIITGGAGNDTLSGLGGDDRLNGGDGDDHLLGGLANDILTGGAGVDTLEGEGGNDTYYVDDAGDTVIEAASAGTDSVVSLLTSYTLTANVENMSFGVAGPVTGVGNDLANSITGGADGDLLEGRIGDDKLYGGLGADNLVGAEGNDTLDGQGGDDTMTGGVGNDTYVVDSTGDVVIEAVGEGTTDSVKTALSSLTLADNVEILLYTGAGAFTGTGNGLANTVIGGANGDTLYGLAGADTLRGGLGGDTLDGGADNDKLYGEAGDDVLLGDAGNDLLYGGAGADSLTGGAGKDTFVIAATADSGVGAGFRDVVTDMDGLDVIDLRSIDANTGLAADQAFSFIGTGAFTSVAGELRYEFDGTDTHVYGDVDGNGVADFEVVINGSVTLAANRFLL